MMMVYCHVLANIGGSWQAATVGGKYDPLGCLACSRGIGNNTPSHRSVRLIRLEVGQWGKAVGCRHM